MSDSNDCKQEEWNLESKGEEKPQDCINQQGISKQQDNNDSASISYTNNTRERGILPLQGKITNCSDAEGKIFFLET